MVKQTLIKNLKQLFRNRGRIAVIIISPIIFMGFFGFVFNSDAGEVPILIGYVNHDEGYNSDYYQYLPDNFNLTENPENLGSLFFDIFDNSTKLLSDAFEDRFYSLSIRSFSDEEDMISAIEIQSVVVGVIIPENFTEMVLATYNTQYSRSNGVYLDLPSLGGNTSVTVMGDQSVSEYQNTYSLFVDVLNGYTDQIYGMNVFTDQELIGGHTDFEFYRAGVDISNFQYMLSGLIVFVIIMNMTNVASVLAEEKEIGTINRFKMSLLPSSHIFIATTLTQLIVGTIQLLIAAVIIEMWGVHLTFAAWMRVYLILQITNINITGLGMIVAAFAKTKQDATTITSVFAAPLGFLSGAFLPVPEVWVVKAWNIQVWDIIPSYHSVQSVQAIFIDNAVLADVIRPLLLLSIFSVVWFIIGLMVYNKRVIKSDT